MKTIRLADLEYEQDYLVYDAFYPLNSLDTPYHIEDYACESSMLYNLSNLVVRVEIHNGECYLSRVCYSNKPNQHINYNLSEQHVASCSGGNTGVCNNPSETISFNGYYAVSNVVDSIKKAVIANGPICGGIESLWHFMSIIGFKTLRAGDTLFFNQGINNYEIIQPNDSRIGQTCWLFKNSKGVEWGDNGCAYFLPELSDLYGLYKLVTPESMVYDDSDIICEDKDGDGFYNWGIGPKPATCPNCPDEPDCDDSDPAIGPFDEDYSCISLCDSPAVLTITSTIWLNKQCKIIVHPGAKLIIDNGLLTCPCGTMWPGIQVWGDTCADQYLNHGGYSQGYLELKNGATIENAVCAIELWHPGDTTTTGGIVMGMDSDHGYQTIHAKVPFAEMDRYSTTLSSLTSGRGTFTMKYAEYAQVPTDVQQRLLKEYEESQKEEE